MGELLSRFEARLLTAAAIGALALAAIPHPARGDGAIVERFTGTARARGGTVLYLEEHAVRRTPERLLGAITVYRDPAGGEIAVLRTDFSRDPYAPSYSFQDLRRGSLEVVKVSADGIELRSAKGSRTLARSHRLVTGQGLDRLVRARLEAVAAGERLSLTYAIPSRLDMHDMRVRALDARPSDPTVRVRVEFSSWIMRLLAPSLEVEHDRATHRLLRYRGVSNLAGADGRNPEVEITYAYPREAAAGPEEPDASL